MNLLKKTILLALIVGFIGSSAFGMEISGTEGTPNLLDVINVENFKIFSAAISGLDVNQYEGLKEAVARLYKLRPVCKTFRDILTPYNMAAILLERGLNIWDRDIYGRTTLYYATLDGQIELIKVLLEAVQNPEQRYSFLMAADTTVGTALLIAARGGYIGEKWQIWGDPNTVLERQEASIQRYVAVAKVLLEAVPEEQRATFVMTKGLGDYTALHIAAALNQVELVRMFLDVVPAKQRIAFVMTTGRSDENTAFFYAAYKGNVEVVKELLRVVPEEQRVALLTTPNRNGRSAFEMAVCFERLEVVQILLASLPTAQRAALVMDNTYFYFSAGYGRVEMAKVLLEVVPEEQRTAFVMAVGVDGNTALHVTATRDHAEMAKALLEVVKNPKLRTSFLLATNSDGDTALDCAVKSGLYGSIGAAKVLLEYYQQLGIEIQHDLLLKLKANEYMIPILQRFGFLPT